MLRGYGLLQLHGIVNLINVDIFVLINKAKNLHPERMGERPEYFRRGIELLSVNGRCGLSHSSCFVRPGKKPSRQICVFFV